MHQLYLTPCKSLLKKSRESDSILERMHKGYLESEKVRRFLCGNTIFLKDGGPRHTGACTSAGIYFEKSTGSISLTMILSLIHI